MRRSERLEIDQIRADERRKRREYELQLMAEPIPDPVICGAFGLEITMGEFCRLPDQHYGPHTTRSGRRFTGDMYPPGSYTVPAAEPDDEPGRAAE